MVSSPDIEKIIDGLHKDIADTDVELYYSQMIGRYSFLLHKLCEILPSRGTVIEAGASPGLFTELMRRAGHDVIALDIYPELHFEKIINKRKINLFREMKIPVIKTDIAAKPFPVKENSADLVMMNETIEHFTTPPLPCIKEIARVLKPGGTFVMTTPNVASMSNRFRFLTGKNIYTDINVLHNVSPHKLHNREYTMSELESLVTQAGLTTREKLFLNLGGMPLPPAKDAMRKIYYAATNLIPSGKSNLYISATKK